MNISTARIREILDVIDSATRQGHRAIRCVYETHRDEWAAEHLPALLDELDRITAERDKYRDALIARHGGEPIALLDELDAARAEVERLRKRVEVLERAAELLGAAMELQADYASLSCKDLDAKYGQVVALDDVCEAVSAARAALDAAKEAADG